MSLKDDEVMIVDALVVGAGLSGLVAARELQNAGYRVSLVDKGRSPGGRLATRRIRAGLADHGAQFFTVRDPRFQEQVDRWLQADLVYVWGRGWSDGSLLKTTPDGHPRYATRGGMNALAKDLAASFEDLQVNRRIAAIDYREGIFNVADSDGEALQARAVLLTPPTPQALDLLGEVTVSDDERAALEKIQYGACLCGLFAVEGGVQLPIPGAIQNHENTVYWLADNQRKGISPDERIITAHANYEWSAAHYDDPEEAVLAFLRAAVEQRLLTGSKIVEQQLKKWRYSVPLQMHPDDYVEIEALPLFFAGDAYGGRARVEGAYLSGLLAGQAMVERLRASA